MKLFTFLSVIGSGLLMAACVDGPSAPSNLATMDVGPRQTIYGADNPEGAIVVNNGGDYTGSCRYANVSTTELTVVRTPNGRALQSCHWDNFPAVLAPGSYEGFKCLISTAGVDVYTVNTHFVLTPSGKATMTCRA